MVTIDTSTDGDKGLETKRDEKTDIKNEISEALEIPQYLKHFRNFWGMRIKNINPVSRWKILEVADKIPVKVVEEPDGSILIEFKLGNKTYKILNPELKTHTHPAYYSIAGRYFVRQTRQEVKLGGMRGDNVKRRKNKELSRYVRQKEAQGLHIAKIEEIKALLYELGKKADLDEEADQIAMLMYITGMDGVYWLCMGDNESSGSKSSRSTLRCSAYYRRFSDSKAAFESSNLCMIAYE